MFSVLLAILLGVPSNPSVLSVPVAEAAPIDLQSFASTTADRYHLDTKLFHDVIQCESRFNPNATSTTGDFGVAQWNAKAHPEYSMQEMLDPYFSITEMAKAWALGKQKMWVCYRKLSS